MKSLMSILITAFAIFCFSGFSAQAADDFYGAEPAPLPIPIEIPIPTVPTIPIPTIPGVSPLKDTYFTVKPDFRRCVSPICGGWFVSAVNRKIFICPDGSVKQECYVAEEKINIPGLSDIQLAKLRQAMSESKVLIQGRLSNAVAYGLLEINTAWLSASDQPPKGIFVTVTDNGIRCVVVKV